MCQVYIVPSGKGGGEQKEEVGYFVTVSVAVGEHYLYTLGRQAKNFTVTCDNILFCPTSALRLPSPVSQLKSSPRSTNISVLSDIKYTNIPIDQTRIRNSSRTRPLTIRSCSAVEQIIGAFDPFSCLFA